MNEETRNVIVTALSDISWCIGYCFEPDNQLVRDKLRNAQRLLTELVTAESKTEEPTQ